MKEVLEQDKEMDKLRSFWLWLSNNGWVKSKVGSLYHRMPDDGDVEVKDEDDLKMEYNLYKAMKK